MKYCFLYILGIMHRNHDPDSLPFPGHVLQYAGNGRLLLHQYHSHVLCHVCGEQLQV